MALRDLPDLLLLRDLDPIPRQRNQPLHHQLTMVPRRPTTSNSSDINNQPIQETPTDPEAGGRRRLNSPENDDVAAGEVVAVEAALLHQSALGLLRVEGGVHGGAVHADDGGDPVGDGDAEHAAGDASLHERPNGGQGSCHVRKGSGPRRAAWAPTTRRPASEGLLDVLGQGRRRKWAAE